MHQPKHELWLRGVQFRGLALGADRRRSRRRRDDQQRRGCAAGRDGRHDVLVAGVLQETGRKVTGLDHRTSGQRSQRGRCFRFAFAIVHFLLMQSCGRCCRQLQDVLVAADHTRHRQPCHRQRRRDARCRRRVRRRGARVHRRRRRRRRRRARPPRGRLNRSRSSDRQPRVRREGAWPQDQQVLRRRTGL